MCKIRRGTYGIPQTGMIANKLLTSRIEKHGYHPCEITPGLWKHEMRPVTYLLTTVKFGVKYLGKEHVTRLIDALQQYHKISIEW